ncbi:hypothetical protein OROMI_024310 [Orobanche minor]
MGKIVLFHLKYDGESKLISVNSTTSFDDFIAHASGKWNGITDLNMVLRYSIADVRNCSLDCEDVLRNLFSICQIISAKLVFVDISKTVEKQIAMIEHQNDTGDQYEHFHAPNEHEHIDYRHVHSDIVDSDFCVNRRYRTNKTAILKTTRQNHLYDKFHLMPRYDVCPELKNKPLLSDNWCHILDGGVGTVGIGVQEISDNGSVPSPPMKDSDHLFGPSEIGPKLADEAGIRRNIILNNDMFPEWDGHMMNYMNKLEYLDTNFDRNLAVSLLLRSLPDSYNDFLWKNHCENKSKTWIEIINELRRYEEDKITQKGKLEEEKGKEKREEKHYALDAQVGSSKRRKSCSWRDLGNGERKCPKNIEEPIGSSS